MYVLAIDRGSNKSSCFRININDRCQLDEVAFSVLDSGLVDMLFIWQMSIKLYLIIFIIIHEIDKLKCKLRLY